ncbi:MAG: DUF1269 domain-containing protein, partial [Chloroflexi bacterium]|nr:DUF1269 domain-containing protein [Chloroflexota bacterium]
MSEAKELIVLAFTEEDKAGDVLKRIEQMIAEGVISVFNMAVLVKYKDGKTKIKETQEVGASRGALFGAILGGLIGLVGGPAGAVIGAVAGATTGGVAAYAIDSGFPNEYLRELQEHLQPGTSAVMLLCAQEWSDRVIQATAQFQGYVIRHILKEELAAYLAAIGAIDNEVKLAVDSPARLEAQISAWQAEIERFMANLTAGKVTTQVETRTQIINLHAKQRRAQEKLYEAWNAEIHACTDKIEALTSQVITAPEETKAELTAELEATRARRRVVREKLYAQVERRIQSWQTEIEDLKKRLTATEMEAGLGTDKRVSALKLFTSVFHEAALPSAEDEV